MNAFLWTIIVLAGLANIGKLIWLAKGEFPERKPAAEAMDVFFNAVLVVWAVFLLSR